MSVGSHDCEYGMYQENDFELKDDTKKLSYIEAAMRYSRHQWLAKQSLCYEDRESVTLTSIVTHAELCFGFNVDENLFDQKT